VEPTQQDLDIVTYESNAPLWTFHIKKRNLDGTTSPYVLTAATVAFIAKVSPDDADGSAIMNYVGTIVDDGAGVGDEFSIVTVQANAAQTATPRNLYYRLEVTAGGNKDTVQTGVLFIKNV